MDLGTAAGEGRCGLVAGWFRELQTFRVGRPCVRLHGVYTCTSYDAKFTMKSVIEHQLTAGTPIKN